MIHAFNQGRVTHLFERLPILLQRDPRTAGPLAGMKIIDVGCGAGLVTEPISRLGAAVIGIDAAKRNVLVAERHARSTGASVQYQHAPPEGHADQSRVFDAVVYADSVQAGVD